MKFAEAATEDWKLKTLENTHTHYMTHKKLLPIPPQGILESYNLIKLNICKQLRHALENVLIHSISLTKYELWI